MTLSCLEEDLLIQKVDADIHAAIRDLCDSCQSLQLATLSEDLQAMASYTPFLLDDNHFFIFVSDLASHTQNLLRTNASSIMLIEDEAKAKNIFARKRLILNCEAEEIARQDHDFERRLHTMQEVLGNTLSVLRTLPDFHLIKLTPTAGNYVQGFGQAFEI